MSEIWSSVVSGIRELTEPYESLFFDILKDCLSNRGFSHRSINKNIERLRLFGNNSRMDCKQCLVLANDEDKLFRSETLAPQTKLQATGRKVKTHPTSNATIMKPDCSQCCTRRMTRVGFCFVVGVAAFLLRGPTKDKVLAKLSNTAVFRCTKESGGHRC